MKQNKYDDVNFFSAYVQMPRSVEGLEAAGEWPVFKELLPDLRNKAVLDLGCGFGWHCRYAREQQASRVVGVDISEKMLRKAREMTDDPLITYVNSPIEDVELEEAEFDVVISSLALHYVESFKAVCSNVFHGLQWGGAFVFSVEHPIYTCRSEQDWCYDEEGHPLHWPVDHYAREGVRETSFLTENVIKYHRTLATYINDLIQTGFCITAVKEPMPSDETIRTIPEWEHENRRPMFMIIAAEKRK